MDYTLHISKRDGETGWVYRFAVVDKSKSYPANFICLLPTKPVQTKSDHGFNGKFGDLFGEKSKTVAVELLTGALKTEEEADIKEAIKKRLKLLESKQVNIVFCGRCKKPFQAQNGKKYKRYLCDECFKLRHLG